MIQKQNYEPSYMSNVIFDDVKSALRFTRKIGSLIGRFGSILGRRKIKWLALLSFMFCILNKKHCTIEFVYVWLCLSRCIQLIPCVSAMHSYSFDRPRRHLDMYFTSITSRSWRALVISAKVRKTAWKYAMELSQTINEQLYELIDQYQLLNGRERFSCLH